MRKRNSGLQQKPAFRRARFYANVALIYSVNVGSIGFIWVAPRVAASPPQLHSTSANSPKYRLTDTELISGVPVRIVIPKEYVYTPGQYVDLPVKPGTYDPTTDSWTLSGYEAQFATASTPANNLGGETFIYGHNNDYVFGAFRHHPPVRGTQALLHTNNGHVFAYKFEKSWSVGPDDVATLNYQGPPILLIQTCTGGLNEWRTMYLFNFQKVVS